MNKMLDLYPMLSEQKQKACGITARPIRIRYDTDTAEEKEYDLKDSILLGKETSWDPERHNFDLFLSIGLNSPFNLFGAEGIAPSGSKLGLVLEWRSQGSGQRGLSAPLIFDKNSRRIEHTFKVRFSKKRFRNSTDLSVLLFLAEEDTRYGGHLANKAGAVLGSFANCDCCLIFDGSGSLFPTTDAKIGVDGPLWKMKYSGQNPAEDMFEEENIALVLNKDHPNYSGLFDAEKNGEPTPMMREVVSSWLFLLFQSVKASDPDVYARLKDGGDIGNGFENRTIASYLRYFVSAFEINMNTPHELFCSINQCVHNKLGSQKQGR